jgi:transcription antitermination factor NusG
MDLRSFDGCWFACQVRTQREQETASLLSFKGYEIFVPTRKVSCRRVAQGKEKEAALFPGYIFCRYSALISDPIVTTPGVIGIIGAGHRPVPVDDREIQSIRIIARSELVSGPHPFLRIGDPTLILEGPLRGVRGKLVAFRKRLRVVVSVHLLQRSVFIESDVSAVTALGESDLMQVVQGDEANVDRRMWGAP